MPISFTWILLFLLSIIIPLCILMWAKKRHFARLEKQSLMQNNLDESVDLDSPNDVLLEDDQKRFNDMFYENLKQLAENKKTSQNNSTASNSSVAALAQQNLLMTTMQLNSLNLLDDSQNNQSNHNANLSLNDDVIITPLPDSKPSIECEKDIKQDDITMVDDTRLTDKLSNQYCEIKSSSSYDSSSSSSYDSSSSSSYDSSSSSSNDSSSSSSW